MKIKYINFIIIITAAMIFSSCGLIIINKGDNESDNTTAETKDITEKTTDIYTSSDGQTVYPVTTENGQTIAKSYLKTLVNRNFGGIGVVIISIDDHFLIPDGSENIISTHVYERNKMVENKYNTIVISEKTSSVDTMYDSVVKSINSGMYLADMLAIPSDYLGKFALNGLLLNLNSLPFTDFECDYYNTEAIQQMSVGYNIYASAGALTEYPGYCYLMFYNRNLAEKYFGGFDIYECVESGEWTWDNFLKLCINIKETFDLEKSDLFTHSSALTDETLIDLMFLSTGQHYTDAAYGKIPQLIYNTSQTFDIIEKAKLLLSNTSGYANNDYPLNETAGLFNNGKVLFYINSLNSAQWFSGMKDSWGMLPIPKLTSMQSYYTSYNDKSIPVISVVSGTTVENNGLFLQAMNASSYQYINQAYFSDIINNYIRDNSSILMLPYITQKFNYDFAYMFGGEIQQLKLGTYDLVRNTVLGNKSFEKNYTNYQKTLSTQLEKTFNMY